LEAGNEMQLHFGQARKTVDQGSGSSGKTRCHLGVGAIILAHVRDQKGNLHFRDEYQIAPWRASAAPPPGMGSAPASRAVFHALAENIGRVEIPETSLSVTHARGWMRGTSSNTRGRVCSPISEFGLKGVTRDVPDRHLAVGNPARVINPSAATPT
jgi:hypothetical protein